MSRSYRAGLLGSVGAAMILSGCMYADAGPPMPGMYSDQLAADEYMWIDRAESLWEAIGDAPPDQAFDFEGAEPWAWVLEDGHTIIVEDGADGLRSYYFSPGADGPFLAVEPGRSFAFDGPRVMVVYGADGQALSRGDGAEGLDEAGVLYARGRVLLRALQRGERRNVDAMVWLNTSPTLWGFIDQWDRGLSSNYGWRTYRGGGASYQWRNRFEAERQRRERLSEAFRRWREGGFQGPPPARWRHDGQGPSRPGTDRPRQPGEGNWGRAPRPTPNGQTPPGTTPPRQPGRWNRPPNAQPTPGAVQPGQTGPRRWNRPAPGTQPDTGQPAQPRPGRWTRPAPGTAPGTQPTPSGRPSWQGRRPDAENRPRVERPQTWSPMTPAPPLVRPDRGSSGDGGRSGGWRRGADSSSGGGGYQRPQNSAPRFEAPRSEPRAAPPPPPPPPPPPAPSPPPPPPSSTSIRADDSAPN